MYRIISQLAADGEVRTVNYQSRKAALSYFQAVCGVRTISTAVLQKHIGGGNQNWQEVASMSVTPDNAIHLAE